jgi:hypothetical protein
LPIVCLHGKILLWIILQRLYQNAGAFTTEFFIDAELSSYPSIALYRIRHLSCKKQVSGGHAGNEELTGALPNTLIEKITIGEPQDEEGIQEVRIY